MPDMKPASSETKTEKFERVAAPRIRDAAKSINLLNNLSGSSYESTPQRRREIADHLQKQLDGMRFAWGIDNPAPKPVPHSETRAAQSIDLLARAVGGSTVESEIRWALDAIARGDYPLAIERLKRCL